MQSSGLEIKQAIRGYSETGCRGRKWEFSNADDEQIVGMEDAEGSRKPKSLKTWLDES